MSVGSLLRAPVLVPLILAGLTGALLFLLARRVAGDSVGLLAFVIWLGDPLNLRFHAGYFSETVTGAMWLIAWWSLLEWRESRDRRWLFALAAAVGWGAITRPLTMLAFAVPVGVVVVRGVARLRAWRDLSLAIVLGAAILAIIPLWSARTTGDWRVTPQVLYTRQYIPYDKPGFGLDTTPPLLPLNPVNRFTYEGFRRQHAEHTPANLPRIAFDRLRVIAREEWSNERIVLVPFVVIGLFAMTAGVAFAGVCSLALFAAYLSYGHWAEWPLYYVEGVPVLSLLAALGIARVTRSLMAVNRMPAAHAAVGAVLVLIAANQVRVERAAHASLATYEVTFRDAIARLPVRDAVVFVHYRPGLRPHLNLVTNSPHLAEDRVWVVNDLGPRNSELMAFAGSRVPVAFYEADGHFEIDRSLLRAPKPPSLPSP